MRRLYSICVKNFGFFTTWPQDKAAKFAVHFDDRAWIARGMPLQDRLHRLHDGNTVAVGRNVVITQRSHFAQAFPSLRGRAPMLDIGDLFKKAPDDLDAVAAL